LPPPLAPNLAVVKETVKLFVGYSTSLVTALIAQFPELRPPKLLCR